MSKENERPTTFEENIDIINEEIARRRYKWSINSIAWMDFDDISQIIRIHIYNKWHMYDPSKPLHPWLNRIITNQLKNIIRNNYSNFNKPCVRCDAAEENDLCRLYTTQCNDCPLYAKWERTKKKAFQVKMAQPLENHSFELSGEIQEEEALNSNIEKVHEHMKRILKSSEWIIYQYLYIENLNEEQVAKKMGYRTSEKNRSPGYKWINNVKKSIMKKVKKSLDNGDIDIF